MNYTTLATQESITTTIEKLKEHNIEAMVVPNKEAALDKIKELIPPGASVMNGTSTTLEEIGFIDYLKSGKHPWKNIHEAILGEQDQTKQATLRKLAVLSDYYLGSVHALSETGEFIVASNTGSQLPHIAYTSQNLLFVVSTKKIVPSLAEGLKRLEEHVVPLENERIRKIYGRDTMLSKILIFKRENPSSGRKIQMILIEESLGF